MKLEFLNLNCKSDTMQKFIIETLNFYKLLWTNLMDDNSTKNFHCLNLQKLISFD